MIRVTKKDGKFNVEIIEPTDYKLEAERVDFEIAYQNHLDNLQGNINA